MLESIVPAEEATGKGQPVGPAVPPIIRKALKASSSDWEYHV